MPSPNASAIFWPKTRSTVVRQSHRVDQSLLSWVFFNILWKVLIHLWKHVRESPVSGPQRLDRVIDVAKLKKHPGVKIEDYPLHGELQDDPVLGLRDWRLKRITPFEATSFRRTVVYWNGGGYTLPSFPQHIDLESRLAVDLDAQVITIPYELAPYAVASLNFRRFVRICGQIANEARALGHELVFAGDSAGAAIATAMLRVLSELCPLLDNNLSVEAVIPDQLFLITPWLDATMSGADSLEFQQVNAQDYYLDAEDLRACGKLWIGNEDSEARTDALKVLPSGVAHLMPKPGEISHPYLSPALDQEHYRLLSQHGVRVTVSLGTRDITSLAGYLYLGRLEEAGIRTHFVEGIGGLHQYLLFQSIGLSEPSAALTWMTAAVKRHTDEADTKSH